MNAVATTSMPVVTIDFETYYDRTYTVTKMTTEEYIRSPRFAVHGAAIVVDGLPPVWVEGQNLAGIDKVLDWSNTILLCHHAQFDGAILAWHYNVVPAYYMDTMAMGRALLGPKVRVGLGSLAQHFGLAAKTVPYDLFLGKHWGDLTEAEQDAVAKGSCHDAALTWHLCELLLSGLHPSCPYKFPPEELIIVDTTIRMFTQPALLGDACMLTNIWQHEERTKNERMLALGVTRSMLNSPVGFAALLEAEGVEIPRKDGKNGKIYPFAKSDEFMQELLENPNERISMLAAARLDVRSTIDQTRAERLGRMAERGALPVYLSYCAALTRRWGGGDKINWQNFPRLDKTKPRKGAIRHAVRAPPGHKMGKVDASQIECRILNWFAGQNDVLEKFREGKDLYSELATKFYGRTITKADTAERGVGKQLELSCGYGAGAKTIQRTAAAGTYGPPVELTDTQAEDAKKLYRDTHKNVTTLWETATKQLMHIHNNAAMTWGPFKIKDHRVFAPNGMFLDYSGLSSEATKPNSDREEWWVETRTGKRRMYGAKLVENAVQFMARVVLSQAMSRMRNRGLRILLTVHDDVYVAINGREHLDIAAEEMIRTPDWMPGIPLACEAKIVETLGE